MTPVDGTLRDETDPWGIEAWRTTAAGIHPTLWHAICSRNSLPPCAQD